MRERERERDGKRERQVGERERGMKTRVDGQTRGIGKRAGMSALHARGETG